MKIKIFYSWQSDLPNTTNRSFIESQIKKTIKTLSDEQRPKTEFILESDSRNETGTPDLAQTIFNKINECDIFIADISIINKGSEFRLTPNPNVLIELGYAAKTLGWSKIICIFNNHYAEIEKLPFDIRGRKPIAYNSNNNTIEEKKKLFCNLRKAVGDIVFESYYNYKEYTTTKRTVDLGMQAILIDFCQFVFHDSAVNTEKYDYQKLLNTTQEQIEKILANKTVLGFYIWRNIQLNIKNFMDFFNNNLETYFLSEQEKRLIAKMVFALREYNKLLDNENTLNKTNDKTTYTVVKGTSINRSNPANSFLLLNPVKDNKAAVIASGDFENTDEKMLLNTYNIKDMFVPIFSSILISIANLVNEWINLTGKYFIVNIDERTLMF